MVRIRVKVMQPDADSSGQHVHLPTYFMVSGTEIYSDKKKGILESVEVQVPDDECDDKGQLSLDKIRTKYRGQPHWDRADLLKDVIVREKKRKGNT